MYAQDLIPTALTALIDLCQNNDPPFLSTDDLVTELLLRKMFLLLYDSLLLCKCSLLLFDLSLVTHALSTGSMDNYLGSFFRLLARGLVRCISVKSMDCLVITCLNPLLQVKCSITNEHTNTRFFPKLFGH